MGLQGLLLAGGAVQLVRLALAHLPIRVHRSAAPGRATVTHRLVVVGAVVQAIVVGNLFSSYDIADGLDPDPAAALLGLAVRLTAVVDEHRHGVAIDDS